MSVAPALGVRLAGVALATAAPDALPDPVAVGSVSWSWGRADVLANLTSPVAALQLLCTRDWWVSNGPLVGRPLVLTYALTPGGSQTLAFVGRITEAAPDLVTVMDPATGRAVSRIRVDLAAASQLTGLANIVMSGPPHPAETFGARAARLFGLAGPLLYGLEIRDHFVDIRTAAQRDVDGVDLLTLITELYDSCDGDRMTLRPWKFASSPEAAYLSYVTRRAWTVPYAGALVANADPAGTVTPVPPAVPADGAFAGGVGVWADARRLEWAERPTIDGSTRLSRVVVNYLDAANGWAPASVTRSVPGVTESATGVHALTVSTINASATAAGATADALAAVAAGEAAAGPMGRLRWVGPDFDTAEQAAALLSGVETNTLWFAVGAQLYDLGCPPVFGVLGASITYADGGWSVTFTPTPLVTTSTPPPVRLQAQHLAAAGQAATLADAHPRLRLSDFGWIGQGLGQSTYYPEPTE